MISKISNPKPIAHSASSEFVQKVGRTFIPIVLTVNMVSGIVRPTQAQIALKIPQTRTERRIATSPETVKACQEKRNNLESQIKSLQLQQKLLPDQIADIKANIEKDKELLKELQAKLDLTDEDKQEIKQVIDRREQGETILGILDKQLKQFANQITALEEKLTRACSPQDDPESL